MVEAFARLIHEIRETFGYRQEDLAERIDTVWSTISAWETDKKNPTRSRLDDLTLRFPEYTARLYVAARFLPMDPGPSNTSGKEFGDVVHQIREHYGLRQIDLAAEVGTCRATISEWERAKQVAFRSQVETLAGLFLDYRPRIYRASRFLPLNLNADQEEKLRKLFDDVLLEDPNDGRLSLIDDII